MKERLDILLVKRNLAPSRGTRFVLPLIVYKHISLHDHGTTLKYVSRGGLKLEKAMNEFDLNLDDDICMDIGASTGGFTDCMLQNGASKVYSVDVGYGQFAWKLRQDPRVVCMEKTNIRYVTPEDIDDALDFASVDVSFISLTKILEPARNLLKDGGQMICLIKPQFEAGREKVGKKGVVRDKAVHLEVVERIVTFALEHGFRADIMHACTAFCNNVIRNGISHCQIHILMFIGNNKKLLHITYQALEHGFSVHHLSYSPIKGPEGNIEYLVHIEKKETAVKEEGVDPVAVVEAAHAELDK